MRSIGGYLELELNKYNEYHKNTIRLNTGRNALEYLIVANNYKKIYLPYYTCDVLLEPINKTGIKFEFYNINEGFEPIFDFNKVKPTEAFLYTNYFGLKDNYVKKVAERGINIIIDNAQSFYSKPLVNVDTFYSARKFFGVPDGAYLYSKEKLNTNLEKDNSSNRLKHLISRIEQSPEEGYASFSKNEKMLANNPMLEMSALTERLLKSINYKSIAKKRKDNFTSLHRSLKDFNQVSFSLNTDQVPFIYPFMVEKRGLRSLLIKEKIYTPQFWPNVLKWTSENSLEYRYAANMIFLPIDQRYQVKDMNRIQEIIKNIL